MPVHHAAIAAATSPATVLGIAHRTGSLQPGKDADLVLLNDQFGIETVMARGKVVHGAL